MFNLNQTSINFILATGRTGSTLLTSVLNSHPNILVANEEPFAYFLYERYKTQTLWDEATINNFIEDFYFFYVTRFPDQFGKREELEKSLKTYPDLTIEIAIKLIYLNFFPQKNKSDIRVLVDKQLKHHLILDELQKQFPQAKYIVLVRDPRDNIAIKLKRAKNLKSKQDVYSASVNWDYVYTSILNKTKNIPSSRIYFLKYEDLVSEPEITMKKVCDFLNITYVPEMLNFHEAINESYHHLSGKGKELFDALHTSLKTKINSKKIGMWQTELSNEQLQTILSICGDTYTKLGYGPNNYTKISKWNKSYIRANLFMHKKNINAHIYNRLIMFRFFSFLRKHKNIKNVPG